MQTKQKHIDGIWWTSEHLYKDHKFVIKMQENKGCKIHIWNIENTKVIKTFRFNFATEQILINKAMTWIDTKINI